MKLEAENRAKAAIEPLPSRIMIAIRYGENSIPLLTSLNLHDLPEITKYGQEQEKDSPTYAFENLKGATAIVASFIAETNKALPPERQLHLRIVAGRVGGAFDLEATWGS